jgi:hypothetical protein
VNVIATELRAIATDVVATIALNPIHIISSLRALLVKR